MNEQVILEISSQAVWVMLKVAAPALLVSLVVGLVVSLLQALTQIQEVTLTFVPKIILVFLTLLLLAPFMLHSLTDFTWSLMARIVPGS